MGLDIQTERVVMRPEWHHTIEDWVARCRARHPGVAALDLTLSHAAERRSTEEVLAIATTGRHSLRVHAAADIMSTALADALHNLEHEIYACEAVGERAPVRPASHRH